MPLYFPPSLRHLTVLLTVLLLSGCQTTRTAFQFAPPAARLLPAPTDTAALPLLAGTAATAALAVQPPAGSSVQQQATARPRRAHRRLYARAARVLASSSQLQARPNQPLLKQQLLRRSQGRTTAEATENGLGTMFIGILGIVVLLVGLIGLLVGGGGFFGLLAGLGALALLFAIVVPYLMGYA